MRLQAAGEAARLRPIELFRAQVADLRTTARDWAEAENLRRFIAVAYEQAMAEGFNRALADRWRAWALEVVEEVDPLSWGFAEYLDLHQEIGEGLICGEPPPAEGTAKPQRKPRRKA